MDFQQTWCLHLYHVISWRSGLGLLMVKFHQFLTELCVCVRALYSFPDDNFSKYYWMFTKLGVCIDSVEIWFGIVNGQISSIFDRVMCLCQGFIFVSR